MCEKQQKPNQLGPLAIALATSLFTTVLCCRTVYADTPAQSMAPSSGHNDSQMADAPLQGEGDLDDLSLEELMQVQVVVTAARREQEISGVPYAISVITAEDIRAAGATTVPDALRLVPGVDVADLSFGNYAVSPRGFHGFLANHALVLVDGRQIFDSVNGGTIWGAWPFQLEDIARIEVIRGPGGVTWGANAVNGVINILTKDPGEQEGLTTVMRGGSRGTFKTYVGYGESNDKVRWRFSGEYEASDGFRKGGSIIRNLEDDYKAGRAAFHAVYERDENNTLSFSAGTSILDGGFPPTPLAGFGMRHNSRSQASYLMATWRTQESDSVFHEWVAFVNDFHAVPGMKQVDYRYQQIGLHFARTMEVDESLTRSWGVDTRVDLLDTSNSDPYILSKDFISTSTIGLYLQEEHKLADRWTLSLGGRVDYENYSGFQPSARASLSYEFSDEAFVYGSVSRAFHSPTPGGRFLHIPLLNTVAQVTSNRDSDPTTLIAYELGYRGRLLDRFDTSLNLFWHDYDEVTTLSPELGPPGLLQNRFDNQSGNVALYGAEFETKWAVNEQLTLAAHYTYQQLNWNVDKPFTERDYITPPKHKAMLSARYTVHDDLRLFGALHFVDCVDAPNPANPFMAQRVDSYLRLDLQAEHDLWNDSASLGVGVKNLLDSGHYEGGTLFLNDAEVPQMIFAELRMRIK